LGRDLPGRDGTQRKGREVKGGMVKDERGRDKVPYRDLIFTLAALETIPTVYCT